MASRSSFLFGHDPSGHARGHAFRKTGFHPRIKSEGSLYPDHALGQTPLAQSEHSLSSNARALSPARLASVIVSKKTFENSIGLFLPRR
jgi:hypothetical protein